MFTKRIPVCPRGALSRYERTSCCSDQHNSGHHAPTSDLPLLAGIAIVTGAFMLIFGHKVLRVGLAVIGAWEAASPGISSAPWAPGSAIPLVLIGAALGFGLGLLFWKLTITSLMAASCGVLSGGLCSIMLLNGWIQITPPEQRDETRLPAQVAVTVNDQQNDTDPPSTLEDRLVEATLDHATARTKDAWSRVNSGLEQLTTEMSRTTQTALMKSGDIWNQLTTIQKQYVAIASVLGAIFGIMLSVGARRCSSALVTAMAGSGLVLFGGLMLTEIIYPTEAPPKTALERMGDGLAEPRPVRRIIITLERRKARKRMTAEPFSMTGGIATPPFPE